LNLKRVLALTGVSAAALLVGGAGLFHTSQPTFALQPTTMAVGCSNTNDPTTISFAAAGAAGITSQTQTGATAAGLTPATLSLSTPLAVVLCGVVATDQPTGGVDANPYTIDGGSFTARVNAPGQILESNGLQYSWNCGALGPAAAVVDSCKGAATVPVAGPVAAVTAAQPMPGNTYHVYLAAGSTFGIIGTATPIITTNVTWTPTGLIAGQTAVTSPSAGIGIVAPAYTIVLSANPSTIPANLPTSTSAQGSVITATLYHAATSSVCTVLIPGAIPTIACSAGGGIAGPAALVTGAAAILAPGAESGVVTFATNLGVFASVGAAPAGPSIVNVTGASQTVSVHCGTIPNTYPTTLIPTPGLVTTLTLNSCTQVSATLVGGGEAGTATVIANFVGDATGAQALPQGGVTVNLTPGPITVSLSTGCNEVITPAALAGGSNGAAVAALASGFNVQSIWVFNNATHTFQALFFAAAGAPTDISSVGPNQSVFICGTGAGTFRVA